VIITSQKKNKLPAHLKILKAFIEGRSFKEISEEFEDVKYRSTAQWIVRKCQGKINDSIDVISEALEKDVLTQEQTQILIEELMGAIIRKMENLFNVEEISKELSPLEVEMQFFNEFFKRIRKYFEMMTSIEE
jgi:predicted AAA+ superfamily ATPase